jgi:uncharacterized metal-binding protein
MNAFYERFYTSITISSSLVKRLSASSLAKYQLLPHCATHAKDLVIVVACNGAATVGQVGNEVARRLTKRFPNIVRMCCLSAVAAGSKVHLDIFKNARAVIAINGCLMKCTSNILKQRGIQVTYEAVVTNEGVNKIPSLDFSDEEVEKIANKIVADFLHSLQINKSQTP